MSARSVIDYLDSPKTAKNEWNRTEKREEKREKVTLKRILSSQMYEMKAFLLQ